MQLTKFFVFSKKLFNFQNFKFEVFVKYVQVNVTRVGLKIQVLNKYLSPQGKGNG